jgi:hypothetical protein
MRRRLCGWLTAAMLGLLAACGGGGGGGGGNTAPTDGRLSGADSATALSAVTDFAPQPAAADDVVNGLILGRLDVVFAADASVGQVNAALDSVGASIVAMRAGSAAMTVAVPRAADAAALQALADTLQAAPGIVAALPGPAPLFAVGPPSPAGDDVNLRYLQNARFPAAWNARRAAGNCANDKVTVIVADAFHRPADALYNEFATQVPALDALGSGAVAAANTTGFHGYDVLTTLAAALDATVPTGANPFPDCLNAKAVQIAGLNPYGITAAIEAALAASSGKVVVNASFGWDACGVPDAGGVLPACTLANLNAPTAQARAIWAAIQRASLAPFADRALVVASAGNEADKPVAAAYLGAGLAPLGSAFNVAATADSTMSFATDATKWEPTPACTTPPCLPSLTATPAQAANIARVLSTLGTAAATPAANVLIAGSVDNLLLERSTFSDFGAAVLAVGEGVPTLLGVPVNGTSFSTPQVAGLVSYLWLLSPELRNRPARDTIAAIKANASNGLVLDGVAIADGLINAYATVLSLDEAVALSAATAPIRLAILDVAGQLDGGGNVVGDGKFDLADLQAYRAFYLDANGAPVEPTTRDHGRFDLNGDGFTGGSRTTRMDLDPRGSTRFGAPQLSVLDGQIGSAAVTYDERAITDARALCFFATTALYTGTDLAARDALLGELCAGAAEVETQSFASLALQVKARNDNCSTPELPECDIFRHSSEPPSTIGSARAEEPQRTLTASSAAGSATASGGGVSSVTSAAGAGGVLTISGSASSSASARYQAPFAAAEGSAEGRANSTGSVVLTRPHAYVLQVTIGQSGFTARSQVSLGATNGLFESSTSVSGVLPAGRHQVLVNTLAAAVARLEKTSEEASASASFTLTLTPQ